MAGSEDDAVVETPGNDAAQTTDKQRQVESETVGDAEEAADELTEAEIDAKLAEAKKRAGSGGSDLDEEKATSAARSGVGKPSPKRRTG